MDWLVSLFKDDSIAHIILLYAFVIAVGVMFGKIKIFGVSLGVTFVLFVGIVAGHFGFTVNDEVLHFVREFGLILFIFSIGLQVGPGFFSSFKEGGMKLNMLAASVVLLGVLVTVGLFYAFGGKIPMPVFVGIMSGAVTNTPGLGAAQEALRQLHDAGQIADIPQIALGYAVAYPLGVTGIILSLVLIRNFFKIKFDKENEQLAASKNAHADAPQFANVRVQSKAIDGKDVKHFRQLIARQFVVSRQFDGKNFTIPHGNTKIHNGDILRIVAAEADMEAIVELTGESVDYDWKESENLMVSRRIVITRGVINGKTLASLRLSVLNVNCTRVIRSGFDLLASPDLVLQVGDRVVVVGTPESIKRVEETLGNTLKHLDHPHIITLFVGIFLGIIFGSIPFSLGMPMPVKLGLAGGPLVIAILLGRFGFKLKLITYTTQSANLLLREIGITLFLASVGISSGGKFVETVVTGGGLMWILCGFIITIVPVLLAGFVGRKFMKMNYFSLMGLISGSMTDPPALAYSNAIAGNDAPAISYSTVYPLTMFLRVILAQILILMFV
ncbi:MAG: putative transporter [Paludibacter sp.]|jgi:putative transport protein|nr:putative transporter [Paludibacter sp.]